MPRSTAGLRYASVGTEPHAPQAGIFALGTSSHSYIELDLLPGAAPVTLVRALADLREPRTTQAGVNFVIGLRPELWRDRVGAAAPVGLRGFDAPVVGPDGFTMPATQHDACLWISGSSYDIVFDVARFALAALAGVATVADETSSWPYQRSRDLTGFVDGTENPTLARAAEVVLVPVGEPGAGGSVLLLQRWAHVVVDWEALSTTEQEAVIGRTKDDSVELDPRPIDSHVARTDQDEFGDIFRRNTPYGTVTAHGTMFVGFAATQGPLQVMLEQMAGIGGPRDALTRFTTPETGAYYFVPSVTDLHGFATDPDED